MRLDAPSVVSSSSRVQLAIFYFCAFTGLGLFKFVVVSDAEDSL